MDSSGYESCDFRDLSRVKAERRKRFWEERKSRSPQSRLTISGRTSIGDLKRTVYTSVGRSEEIEGVELIAVERKSSESSRRK